MYFVTLISYSFIENPLGQHSMEVTPRCNDTPLKFSSLPGRQLPKLTLVMCKGFYDSEELTNMTPLS